jgi:hypothetical protein
MTSLMLHIDVHCRLAYEIAVPSSFHFLIAANQTEHQVVSHERLVTRPDVRLAAVCEQPAGNRLHVGGVAPGRLELAYSASVALSPTHIIASSGDETPFDALPAGVLAYLRPSRYCQSDLLTGLAGKQFDRSASPAQRVTDVCTWVHDHLDYVPGVTDSTTTALDVLARAAGVCRDYAHLAISLCRALGIATRYVSAYAVGLEPADFHGLFEAYLDGGWHLYDATNMARLDQVVRIGVGRDAADVAFASFVGVAELVEKDVMASATGEPGQPGSAAR